MSRHLLIFGQELGVLLEDHFHFVLKLGNLLALEFEDGVLLLQHGEVAAHHLLHSEVVLLDLELLADRASVHSLRSFHAIVAF
jgi:hypothetical protein